MRTLLHIGEMAQLLGVTTKTIRHYQKVGLLQAPERTAAGYRLFSAQDLLRLQRVRRLQALGLSLKQIKTMLGKPVHEHSLREVLEALDKELINEIQLLQTRRERIRTLLDETDLLNVEQLPVASPGLALAQELLGEHINQISPEMMEIEKQTWNLFETFHWPNQYRTSIEQVMRQLAAQPEQLTLILSLGELLSTLASLPEDSPEIEGLLETCLANEQLIALLQSANAHYTEQSPAMAQPFTDIFSELLGESFSPAQWRFFKELSRNIQARTK